MLKVLGLARITLVGGTRGDNASAAEYIHRAQQKWRKKTHHALKFSPPAVNPYWFRSSAPSSKASRVPVSERYRGSWSTLLCPREAKGLRAVKVAFWNLNSRSCQPGRSPDSGYRLRGMLENKETKLNTRTIHGEQNKHLGQQRIPRVFNVSVGRPGSVCASKYGDALPECLSGLGDDHCHGRLGELKCKLPSRAFIPILQGTQTWDWVSTSLVRNVCWMRMDNRTEENSKQTTLNCEIRP